MTSDQQAIVLLSVILADETQASVVVVRGSLDQNALDHD
jgi:hypothetical protein